jgi:partner of Y14 and mago
VKKEASKPAPPKETKVEEISEKLQDKLQISGDDPTIELSKKLKRIRRKLREVEILDEKIKAGEITAPEKDQLEKISRRKMFEEVSGINVTRHCCCG